MVSFPNHDDHPDEEIDDPHPAVVIQTDHENLETATVIPVSDGTDRDADTLTEVELTPREDGVDKRSLALLHQITTVSIQDRIVEDFDDPSAWKMGEVSASSMDDIEDFLTYFLGL